MQQRARHPRAGSAQGVAKSNGTPVRVDFALLPILFQAKFPYAVYGLTRESLVYLPPINILGLDIELTE